MSRWRCIDRGRRAALVAFAVLALLGADPAPSADSSAWRHIGIEGSVAMDLPRPDYRPRPLDDRTELILRIESVTPASRGQQRYQLYYMGLEPGAYTLADYLVRPDGSRPDELGDRHIEVRAMLPEDHNGQLNPYVARPFPFIGGYRAFLVALGVGWVGSLAAHLILSRRKPPAMPVAPTTPPPTLAELLRPLVEQAAAGRLGVEGQARLERLFTGYWRERLELPEQRMAEALARLKAHAEAGALLHALERWLHQPGGVSSDEIASILRPYRDVPPAMVPEKGGHA